MEGWRQERLGSRAGTHREEEKNKNILTRNGILMEGLSLSLRRWACAGGGLKFLNEGDEGQGNGTIVHLDGVGRAVRFNGEFVLEAIGATGLKDFGEIKETSTIDAILEFACFIARHSNSVHGEIAANSGEAAA
jgi:hypothetical protein